MTRSRHVKNAALRTVNPVELIGSRRMLAFSFVESVCVCGGP